MKLLFVGDLMFERELAKRVLLKQNPLRHVQDQLRNYDHVIANFETSVVPKGEGEPLPKKVFRFKSPIECLRIVHDSNITILNLANNHTMDYGGEALVDTMRELGSLGIKFFGAGKNQEEAFSPLYLNDKNKTIAFIGLNRVETHRTKAEEKTPGHACFKYQTLVENAVRTAREHSDLLFILPHWGKEYSATPNEKQLYWGPKFIDWGADTVIGTHPHVIQPSEIYRGKPIYYSIGNFCFSSQKPKPATLEGLALEIEIQNGKIDSIAEHKVSLDSSGEPRFE